MGMGPDGRGELVIAVRRDKSKNPIAACRRSPKIDLTFSQKEQEKKNLRILKKKTKYGEKCTPLNNFKIL